MRSVTPSNEHEGLFLAVRRGVPLLAAGTLLALSIFDTSSRGWLLLGAMAALAEVSPTFRHGESAAKAHQTLLRWDSAWACALRPFFRFVGREEAWLLSFFAWNNARVVEAFEKRRAKSCLVLLPHCIQMATCRADVIERLSACHKCGKCALDDVARDDLFHDWNVKVCNRSHKAYRTARSEQPDLMIAVSCVDRLMKGLRKLPEIPSYVIALDLPYGMCVDTTLDAHRLSAAMSKLVEPPRHENILPLERDTAASAKVMA